MKENEVLAIDSQLIALMKKCADMDEIASNQNEFLSLLEMQSEDISDDELSDEELSLAAGGIKLTEFRKKDE